MRAFIAPTALLALAACSAESRDAELNECMAIQSTTYVEGQVRDCLVERHGWSRQDADRAEQDRRNDVLPDGSRKPKSEIAEEGSRDDTARQ